MKIRLVGRSDVSRKVVEDVGSLWLVLRTTDKIHDNPVGKFMVCVPCSDGGEVDVGDMYRVLFIGVDSDNQFYWKEVD